MNHFWLRIFFQSFIALIFVFYIAVSYSLKVPVVNQYIKQYLEEELTQSFDQSVSISTVEGTLFSSILLKNIVINNSEEYDVSSMVEIDQINVFLNVMPIVLNLNFFKGIHRLEFNNVMLNIIRNQNEKWNIIEFISRDSKSKQQIAFNGIIDINNIYGTFIDKRGWQRKQTGTEKKLSSDFLQEFKQGHANIDFSNETAVTLSFQSKFSDFDTSLDINGVLDATVGSFKYELDIRDLNMETWGDYLFPFPAFKISDDVISIFGYLKNKDEILPNTIPFYYDLDINFSSLNFEMPYIQYPLEKINGTVNLNNYIDREIKLLPFTARVDNIGVDGFGELNLDHSTLDISFKTHEPENINRLSRIFSLGDIPLIDGSLNMEVLVSGKIKSPVVIVTVDSDVLSMYDNNLGRVSFDLLIDQGSLTIESHTDSKLNLFGQISRDNRMDILLTCPNFLLSALDRSVTINANIFGNRDAPKVEAFVSGFILDSHGFQVNSFAVDLDYVSNEAVINDLVIGLTNGQSLRYGGNFSLLDHTIQLDQIELTDTLKSLQPDYLPLILSMDSQLKLTKPDDAWLMTGSAHIIGEDLRFNDQLFQYFDIMLTLDGDFATVYLKDVRRNSNEKIMGTLYLNDQKLLSSSFALTNTSLSVFSPYFTSINKYGLTGNLSGKLSYSLEDDVKLFEGDLKFDQFQSMHGFFGDLEVSFDSDQDTINLNSFQLSGPHSVYMSGYIDDIDGYSFDIKPGSYFNVSKLNILKEKGWKGLLSVDGNFQYKSDFLQFKGNVFSNQLKYGSLLFTNFSSSFVLNQDYVKFDHFKFVIDEGRVLLSGDFRSNDNPIWQASFSDFFYDLHFETQNFNLSHISTIMKTYSGLLQEQVVNYNVDFFDPSDSFIYSKYDQNKLARFNQLFAEDEVIFAQNKLQDFSGFVTGRFDISNIDYQIKNIWLNVDDFQISDIFQIKSLQVISDQLDPFNDVVQLNLHDAINHGSVIDKATINFQYNYVNNMVSFLDSSIFFNNNHLDNIVRGNIDFKNQDLDLGLHLVGHDIDIISFFFSRVLSIQNEGAIHMNISGPFKGLTLNSKDTRLRDFVLTLNPDRSLFTVPFIIESHDLVVDTSHLDISNLNITWQGSETFRRVTRTESKNSILLNGDIDILPFDLLSFEDYGVSYNLVIDPTVISINFPTFYSGDILFSESKFYGQQILPLSKSAKTLVTSQLGTVDEQGPMFESNLIFRDGVINIDNIGYGTRKPRIKLDLSVNLGASMFIDGGIFGGGIYNLANNIYLEVESTNGSQQNLDVTGSLNSPIINTSIDFYSGAINIFDGVYELMTKNQQLHYFQNFPELSSNQLIKIDTLFDSNRKVYEQDINLNFRALRLKEESISTVSLTVDEYPFTVIVLIFDGQLEDIHTGIRVLEYGVDDIYSAYPNYQFKGSYVIDFSEDQSLNDQSYYALNLLLPSIVTGSEDVSFYQLGRQQVNNIFRSSIRPYERRLAKRVGLYDFRLDYDIGKTIFPNETQSSINQDLLGVYIVADLYNEKLFLNLRTDVDLSEEETELEKGVKVTQFELKYFLLKNFSVSLKNINEYSDVTTFDPRFSLSYGYAF